MVAGTHQLVETLQHMRVQRAPKHLECSYDLYSACCLLLSQADNVTKEPELNGKKDGKLPDKSKSIATGETDIKELEAKGEVSPEGQGAAKAATEYLGAPLPANEKERHETLCACQILDSAPDPRFDDITKLVRDPC